jgi:pimeloyl-ACP methyl ester carboxylesterase
MTTARASLRRLRTAHLEIAYEEHGPADGTGVVLLHGFPYDPRCYDAVVAGLEGSGLRVIVPYLRGFGPTRFLDAGVPRSGQQAALARDLRELLDGLALAPAALVGYDWGGRAACIAAALWPERVRCLVSGEGYNIQDIAAASAPRAPVVEHRLWYQYYLHTARGRAGLEANRRDFARLLWRLWSPGWTFSQQCFARSAASFDNPDFVEVVVHSYRHRFGYAPGDPALDAFEHDLARRPPIAVPTVVLCGAEDALAPPAVDDPDAHRFAGWYERRILPGVGHNIPQEAPAATVSALNDALRASQHAARPAARHRSPGAAP